MTLIDLDPIHFYQSPSKAHLAGKRPSVASVGDVPVICGEGYTPTVPRSYGGWGEQLYDYDLIEDLIGPVSKDPLDLFSKPAPDLKGTELYGRGNVHLFWLWWVLNNGSRSLEQTRSHRRPRWRRWRERSKPSISRGSAARCRRSTKITTNGLETR